jgi:hypothetical protein
MGRKESDKLRNQLSGSMTAPMNTRPDRYRNAVVAHIYIDGAADAREGSQS